jgi:hypothetical protein
MILILFSLGFYVFYFIFVAVFHLILLSLPFITTALAWTLTNISHNLAQFIFLHLLKGAPWIQSTTANEHFFMTHWEQLLLNNNFWSNQRKTLFTIPIVLFLLTCLYTKNEETHFIINFISLILVIVPKLPFFHRKRLFNINKY